MLLGDQGLYEVSNSVLNPSQEIRANKIEVVFGRITPPPNVGMESPSSDFLSNAAVISSIAKEKSLAHQPRPPKTAGV